MFGRRKADVLIVGAGPVGLFSALVLTKRGIPVKIVDREWRTGAHSYALALHPQSLELLEDVGLLDDVRSRAYPVRTIALYEGAERRGELRIPARVDGSSSVVAMSQDVLEDLLETALHRMGVCIEWNHEVVRMCPSGDRVEATIDRLEKSSVGYAVAHTEWIVARTRKLAVPFVIGADGNQSQVRSTLGIEFPEVAPSQYFAIFEFRTDADLRHEMALVFDEKTTNVLWPLPNGCCRWSFQLEDFEDWFLPREKDRNELEIDQARYLLLSEDRLRNWLRTRAPWFEGSIDEIRWRKVVRFDSRLAAAFGAGRMWLAGDAGHMTRPGGIQSMNVGLQEAYDLATAIADALSDRGTCDPFARYNRERLETWSFLLGLNGRLRADSEAEPWIRRHVARMLPCLPASGDDLMALAAQVGLYSRAN